jgi:S-DNA-T family DNA segregation ATPase FtsK/SpoIIIE
MQSAGNMRTLMKTAEKTFISAKNLNYDQMSNEEKIKTKMMEHGMMIQYVDTKQGSSVDLYRFNPSIGLKMSRLKNYVEDVEQVLGVSNIRILAPIPDSTLIGFEVPRKDRSYPSVPTGGGFDIAIGQDIMGEARRFDFRTAPHILVAGASGQGKSVWLNGFIHQIASIPDVELHLFDPKRVELAQHKSKAVEYKADIMDIHKSLESLVAEMGERYKLMETAGQKNITGMPGWKYKVAIVDEYGELIVAQHTHTETEETGHIITKGQHAGTEKVITTTINLSNEIEKNILRIAQLGRACGIHMVIATQRPSVKIVSGEIKANFPTKVVFKTSKAVDSLVILDEIGAEKLLGKGDMLFVGDNGIERLQGFNC